MARPFGQRRSAGEAAQKHGGKQKITQLFHRRLFSFTRLLSRCIE
jgi:hypothetical protein